MNKQQYAETFGRLIEPNEIVFDYDNREFGAYSIFYTAINLCKAGYNFEVWKAQGQKSPHLHIKNIHNLENLTPEQLEEYKKLFLFKYCPDWHILFLDFKLAGKHRIAEETKSHYKYHTKKELLEIFNPDKENFAEFGLLEKAREEKLSVKKIEITTGFTNKINQKFSIIKIAKKSGIHVKNNKAVCPFHADKNPSLNFNDSKGLFYCFGCGAKGNLTDFLFLIKTKLKISIENVI